MGGSEKWPPGAAFGSVPHLTAESRLCKVEEKSSLHGPGVGFNGGVVVPFVLRYITAVVSGYPLIVGTIVTTQTLAGSHLYDLSSRLASQGVLAALGLRLTP